MHCASMKRCLSLLLLFLLREVVAERCPSQCGPCPAEDEESLGCAPGVPVVLDGCACCPVCAHQAGESCSEVHPCHEESGLYCDYSAQPAAGQGTCMVLDGDHCVFDGVIYQSGETFQPSCKYQCTCQDGHIGCVPRCNQDLLLPGPDCPFPRKVQVPGECCDKWVCEDKAEVDLGGFAMAAYRQEATLGVDASDSGLNCIEQTTEWSACSKSCGMGMSSRVTNRNPRCDMVKQHRLCIVRPCQKENQKHTEKKGKKCQRTKKSLHPIHFEYKNCTSIHAYRPKFCGVCSDGRCCTPHATKTAQIEFQCPRGKVIKRPMMMIATCACHNNCPQENAFSFRHQPMFSGLQK